MSCNTLLLTQERSLVHWLVKAPTERDVYAPRKLTLAMLTRLEEVWKTRPAATLDDMDAVDDGDAQGDGEHVEPVALRCVREPGEEGGGFQDDVLLAMLLLLYKCSGMDTWGGRPCIPCSTYWVFHVASMLSTYYQGPCPPAATFLPCLPLLVRLLITTPDTPGSCACRYTDVYQFHAVFRPLVAMEADYDRAMKESQSRDNISLRWDWGLNHKRVAYFYFQRDDTELRLVPGDELRLCHRAAGARGSWEGSGCVIRFDQSEEVCLEMNSNVSEGA
jgi:hypothetical protein